MPSQKETRVYVGNLPGNCTEKEVQQMFQRYGKIVSLTVKNPRYNDNRASSFAFIEYEDPADADDVVRKKNGMRYDGAKIRVEFPHGNERGRDRDRYSRFGGGGGGSNFNRRGGGGGGYGNRDKVQRSRYRLRVTGMPLSGSWQDLKDHMREIGEVCFADVDKHGGGVVEFFSGEDMKLAMKKLDNSKFRSHEGDSAYIHLSLDDSDQSRSRSRSHSRSRNSRSRSNDRGSSTPHGHGRRTRRSPTYSPIRHTKGSGSRSRSRSPRSRSPAPRKRERSERD